MLPLEVLVTPIGQDKSLSQRRLASVMLRSTSAGRVLPRRFSFLEILLEKCTNNRYPIPAGVTPQLGRETPSAPVSARGGAVSRQRGREAAVRLRPQGAE